MAEVQDASGPEADKAGAPGPGSCEAWRAVASLSLSRRDHVIL